MPATSAPKTRQLKRRVPTPAPTLHPYDTNDYLDLPDGVLIEIPITWGDRIQAVCEDVHHCTIANAFTRDAKSIGIMEMGPRGVSKTFVSMKLDPKVHPWSDPDRWYRGELPRAAANVVAELDKNAGSPTIEAQNRRALRAQAKLFPDGEDAVWMIITIKPPPPSKKKGYRKNQTVRGLPGSGTKAHSPYTRRKIKATTKRLQP